MDRGATGGLADTKELVQEGFRCGRVVMLNEAHDGLTRCIRTSSSVARSCPGPCAGRPALGHRGAKSDDAEAANTTRRPPNATDGYLAVLPDMVQFIQAALELGWTLWPYEADLDHAPAALVDKALAARRSPIAGRAGPHRA